jgi:hypothetical protein
MLERSGMDVRILIKEHFPYKGISLHIAAYLSRGKHPNTVIKDYLNGNGTQRYRLGIGRKL